jgi:hypothetical protein
LFILVWFFCLCSVPCTQCYLRMWIVHSCLIFLSLFCALYPMLSASVNCSFLFGLFVSKGLNKNAQFTNADNIGCKAQNKDKQNKQEWTIHMRR